MPRKKAPTKRPAPDGDAEAPPKKLKTGNTDSKNSAKPSEMPSRAKTDTTKPTFLRLPAEIRNQIYGYVLGGYELEFMLKYSLVCGESCHDSTGSCPGFSKLFHRMVREARLGFMFDGYTGHFKLSEWKGMLSLIFVCRQIHEEARLLPYSLNSFALQANTQTRNWIMALNADQRIAMSASLHYQFFNTSASTLDLGKQLMQILPNLNLLEYRTWSWKSMLPIERVRELENLYWLQQMAAERGMSLVVIRQGE